MIEKRITQQLLETGQLALTERECSTLTLPEHSSSINLELEGEPFLAQWSGRSRQLSGELLSERLQDYGQEGGLLRLRLVDQVYRLQLLPPGTASQITVAASPPVPVAKSSAAKAKRRRATVDRQFHPDTEYDWGTAGERTIGFLSAAREMLAEQLKAAGFDTLDLVELRLQGEELATLDDFEELLAVDVSNVDRMPHQEAVARHALSRLRGRAVLADEVGLGKTIEAGLAIKELALRGLAKRVLILCPAPLRDQWREEMNNKFDMSFDVAARGADVRQQDKLILSLTLGRSNADKLTKKPWDIVIVDEAHRAAGSGARKTRDLITSLTTACRYAFFLTATPVQNDLLELYRLVELLRPGTFSSVTDFKRQFMRGYDPRTPNDPAALRRLISSVMIRTTRAQAGVDRVVRRAVDVPVTLGPRENELYALATQLLRNVMRESGDTIRRRSLALRLTASPFSMGTTSLRMADRHPDARVREVLTEVGHLAMDIKSSAREDKALQITRDWMREHGRVLIFTQHTDTVTGLLRRMEAEGLSARSFHGSMSAGERAATIAAFRSGDAPIMISTDAGAEGQNLQFCNCVLNYDLPWNPMRIEQRIGRVDRLTQPKDEVFVANLYAQGTIDESVFRLLAEKLRMFELLFGQVTTILGELDDSKTASFETRVMEALFAENDYKMNNLLSQLGTELVHAREKASELIAADSGMSQWMASAFDHREGLTKAGSTELAPEVSERARMRQRRVQTWVRNVLHALDAAIVHDTGDGDGAFLTAKFDEEFEPELGGRTLMHLAFDRFGLEHHPDAELCAVGSPVFDELLGLLRIRGDMHATIPVIPDDIGPSPYPHGPSIRLVRRHLIPSGSWSGQATFRTTIGEAETTEHLITADINGHNQSRLPRRPLQDGESLPASFGTAPKVIAQFERAATAQLESLRRERSKMIEIEQDQELGRISHGYTAQIADTAGEERARLQRALRSEETRLSRRPDVRARSKILAVTLHEDDWIVEETWAGPSGDEATLTYEWGTAEPPIVSSAVSGHAIGVLALCSAIHWIDQSELMVCESCHRSLCQACGDNAVFAGCATCGQRCCGQCRRETGGLCRTCASPERAPEMDDEFSIAWKLNGDIIVRVGERVAELSRPASTSTEVVVAQERIDDPRQARLRAYAKQEGLPLDCGLVTRNLTGRHERVRDDQARLYGSEKVKVELSTVPKSNSWIDIDALADVPQAPEVHVVSEEQLGLADLLKKLRSAVKPPPRPAVLVTRRSNFVDAYLEADRIVREVSHNTDDGSPRVTDVQTADIRWHVPTPDEPTVGVVELADIYVTLQRRNEAILVSTRHRADELSMWIAYPEISTAAEQLGCYDFLCSLGAAGGRLGKRTDDVLQIDGDFPTPSECELRERDIRPVANLVDLTADTDIVPADGASLTALGVSPNHAAAQGILRLPNELSAALLDRTNRAFTAALCNGLDVTETWRGHGTATHTYQTFDGSPLAPRTDDGGIRQSDFGVCRDGHFYAAGTAAQCAACNSWACRACDQVSHQASVTCQECSHPVCRRCMDSTHQVIAAQCLLCSDRACSDCGRDPQVAACTTCERVMCASCRVHDLCPACSQLAPITDDQRAALPEDLAVAGATIHAGVDNDAVVVVINRGRAYEQAIIRNGAIDRWIAFYRSHIDDGYRLRLAASRELQAQMLPATEVLEPESPRTDIRLVVRSNRVFRAAWSAPDLVASGRSPEEEPSPDRDLTPVIRAQFPRLAYCPEPVLEPPSQLVPVLSALDDPSTSRLSMRWERSGFDVAIVPSGISQITIDDSDEREAIAEWQQTQMAVPWMADSWNPLPTVWKFAACGDTEAVIASMASLETLGVRGPEGADWYVITASKLAPAASLLSRRMGLGDADEVGVFTDPNRIMLSTVSNATAASLSVTPLGHVKSGPRSSGETTLEALAAWAPNDTVVSPELGVLPQELRFLLEKSARPMPRTRVEIGALITETVTVGGDDWRYQVTLAPGQTDARRADQIGRHPLDWGGIDREGHFGSVYTECGYCHQLCCTACVDGIVMCDCCGIAICKRCVREPFDSMWLCHACSSTRPPSRQEARGHGRLLSARGMLVGTDPLHTVVVEHAKSHWQLHQPNGEKQLIVNPSVARYFDERLANDGQ
ncbi:superfamily II DNA or RNA helicase [Mycolicibacterium sp. BK634]|uniref:DEAD/DEAH box helicase n=1 Tax=Mycolicibacterium sp. BK634 TaxID=2587099 RepID=UPI00161B44A4|nr:SNF2-related protein [Mycolicibacterium sp. BK634]MBB3747682.1 superfamily II DNA or RNA helicase [Mycolicibacterium sp. BK634]